MTDELDKLKQGFEAESEIKASARAKKTAINLAMQVFEKQHETSNENVVLKEQQKKTENNFQGNSSDARLKDEDNIFVSSKSKNDSLFNLSNWSKKIMKLSYLFPVAAASALAVSVLVLNPQILKSPKEESAVLKSAVVNRVEADLESTVVANSADMGASMPQPQVKKEVAGQPSVVFNEVTPISSMEFKRMAKIAPQGMPKRAPQKPKMVTDGHIVSATRIGKDKFESVKTNPLKLTTKEPVSTFSIDVDTASYSFMRASINRNSLPQKDAVRIEELINYFPYDYPSPSDSDQPFQVSTTVMPTPWNANTKLLHIGIKGYTLPKQENPKSNLVFLLDTSGSMGQSNKLPLLINSFKLLLTTLQPNDLVSIVAYAGSAGTVLEPTKVSEKAKIIQALERLSAGGSTAGGEGIRLAYQLAEANLDSNDKNSVNRVILATDGDFNVGISNQEELKSFIERKRQSGVFLSVLGFGMGNYNDALMQTLAQNGNGNAAYIDSLSEARKVLVEEASSTLFTIAKDVKIQMEFNPKAVSEYRLIGYETRALKREDFNNDKVDAGDIGAGHTVTAIYEITPTGSESRSVDPLRYGEKSKVESNINIENKKIATIKPTEYGYLKLRYKLPNENKSKLIEAPIKVADEVDNIDSTSTETRFATAVAAFGQLLRGGQYTGDFGYDDIIKLAQKSKGEDPYGYRAEFINLVRLAKTAEALR
ncbi:MAG TPA: VWA domain-containing protein [Leucothrix sp.]|nr:VWA domain-containing protein [Leucothrix sp.]